jgi:hypothetical protein
VRYPFKWKKKIAEKAEYPLLVLDMEKKYGAFLLAQPIDFRCVFLAK